MRARLDVREARHHGPMHDDNSGDPTVRLADSVITFTADAGTLTYLRTAGGEAAFTGDAGLLAAVQAVLDPAGPGRVRVIQPNVDHVFTPARDTPADIAAAMLCAGAGRGDLCDTGWDALADSLDLPPTDPTVIH